MKFAPKDATIYATLDGERLTLTTVREAAFDAVDRCPQDRKAAATIQRCDRLISRITATLREMEWKDALR